MDRMFMGKHFDFFQYINFVNNVFTTFTVDSYETSNGIRTDQQGYVKNLGTQLQAQVSHDNNSLMQVTVIHTTCTTVNQYFTRSHFNISQYLLCRIWRNDLLR